MGKTVLPIHPAHSVSRGARRVHLGVNTRPGVLCHLQWLNCDQRVIHGTAATEPSETLAVTKKSIIISKQNKDFQDRLVPIRSVQLLLSPSRTWRSFLEWNQRGSTTHKVFVLHTARPGLPPSYCMY